MCTCVRAWGVCAYVSVHLCVCACGVCACASVCGVRFGPVPRHLPRCPSLFLLQFANSQQAARMLDAVSRVKTLLASGSDKAVLAGMVQWKAKDANTKTPSGRG
jgi:hypothetical protein